MAFKGGFYRKPVNIDFDGIVGLYTAGKARAEQTREGVRKERGEQLKALSEASNFEVSGIEDFDQLIQGMANNARTVLLDAHKANIAGEGTRSMSAAETSNQSSQMQMLGKMSEMKAKKIEEVKKLVEKGEASQAMLENEYATFFQDEAQKLVITDPDGKQRTANRTLTPVMWKDDKGRSKHGLKVKQEYVDQDGKLQTFEGYTTVADVVNPRNKFIKQQTVITKSQEVLDVFGKRQFAVGPDGVEYDNPFYNQVGSGPNGERFFMRPIAQEMFADVRNTVENNISNLSDDDYVAMIQSMGGGTVTDGGFKGYRPLEQVNQAYGGLYDEEGNSITFQSDPLVIMRNQDMSYNISEDNKKIVDAYVRDNVYKGMNVTAEEIRTGVVRGSSGSETTDYGMTVLPMSTVENGRSNEYLVNNFDFGAEYYRDVVAAELIVASSLDGGANVNQITDVNDFLRFGYNKDKSLYDTNTKTAKLTTANKYFSDMGGLGIQDTKIVGAGLSNFKKLYPQAKYTSVAGYEINEVTGMIGVQTNSGFQVHFLGTADIADMKKQIASGGGNVGGTSTSGLVGLSVAKLPVVSKPLTDSELTTRWKERYKKDPDFAQRANAIAESYNLKSGENPVPTTLGMAKIGPKKWWYDVLETYK